MLPWFLLVPSFLFCPPPAGAEELLLAGSGVCEYQVVLPDESASPVIGAWLAQVARLVQAAFAASGFEVPVVAEHERDQAKPGIYLGDTAFARAAGVEVTTLEGWSYVHRAVGRDLVIAGHDHNPPVAGRSFFHRLGTAKGAVDFLRQYAGARFLYPEAGINLSPETNPASVARVDFAACPEIEFLPSPTIGVPAGLDRVVTPFVNYGYAFGRLSFVEIANNMFPQVDEALSGYTWDKAAPVEGFYETSPQMFALVDGVRVRRAQYCLSSPDFQARIYHWTRRGLELGLKVSVSAPYDFEPCRCGNCRELYGAGDDWGEKIWRFHLEIAGRLKDDVPGGTIILNAYGPTAGPPSAAAVFPPNVVVGLDDLSAENLARWGRLRIPGGVTAEIYDGMVFYRDTISPGGYTPTRTPLYMETQAKRFYEHRVVSAYRGSSAQVYGLEGPVFYAWGRLLDDPENNRAADLVREFVEAAFGAAAAPMRRFYDRLYHGIELYAGYLAFRGPAWAYTDMYGQDRRQVSDPFQLLGFLYPPDLLESLDRELSRAEALAGNDRTRTRLAQVRREFDWLKDLARVIHLYHAHRVAPDDVDIYALLLGAIDARNDRIAGMYDGRGRVMPLPGWSGHRFFPVHGMNLIRLAAEPFADTPLNWDTAALRTAAPEK